MLFPTQHCWEVRCTAELTRGSLAACPSRGLSQQYTRFKNTTANSLKIKHPRLLSPADLSNNNSNTLCTEASLQSFFAKIRLVRAFYLPRHKKDLHECICPCPPRAGTAGGFRRPDETHGALIPPQPSVRWKVPLKSRQMQVKHSKKWKHGLN